jgi:hypothetical protein
VYRFDMGSHTPPDEVFAEFPTVSWKDNFYITTKMWDADRYLFATVSGGGEKNYSASLVFDRHDPAAGGFSALGPGGENGLFLDGVAFTPMYVRDNRLVGYMRALDIADGRDGITHPGLAPLAATIKEESNPVIVIAKFK